MIFFKRPQCLQLVAFFLVVVLAAGTIPVTGQEPIHWSDRYTNALLGYQVLPTCVLHPDEPLTLDAFGIRMSYLLGNEAVPAHVAQLTRWEVAVYIQTAFRLEFADVSALYRFADYYLIPEFARPAVATLVANGIMTGHDCGMLDPLGHVTHAQVSALLMRTAGTVFSSPGDFAGMRIATNALVNTGGVNISDTVIGGNLFITEGAYDGEVRLSNVTTDFMLVRGAGRLEIIDSHIYAVDMYITTGDIEVFAYPYTHFLTVARSTGTVYLEGHYLHVIVLGEDVNVVIREGATVENLHVIDGTGYFHITIDGNVDMLWMHGSRGTITGTGYIQYADGIGPGVVFDMVAIDESELGDTPAVDDSAIAEAPATVTAPPREEDNDSHSPTPQPPANGGGSGSGNGTDNGNTTPPTPPIGEVNRDPYTNDLIFIDDLGNQIIIPATPPPYGDIKYLHCVLIQLGIGDTITTVNGIITEIIVSENLALNGNTFTPQHPVDIYLGSGASITVNNSPQSNITIVGTNNNLVELATNPFGANITVGGSLNINSQHLAPLELNITGGADINLTLPGIGMATLVATHNMQPASVTLAGRDITITTLEYVPYTISFSIGFGNRLNLQLDKGGRSINIMGIDSLSGITPAEVQLRHDNVTLINTHATAVMGTSLENVTLFAQDSSIPHSSICAEQDHSLCDPPCLP